MCSRNNDSYQNNNNQYSYEFTFPHFYILLITSTERIHNSVKSTITKAMIAILMMNITVYIFFLPAPSRFASMPSLMNKTVDTITNRKIAIGTKMSMDNFPVNAKMSIDNLLTCPSHFGIKAHNLK